MEYLSTEQKTLMIAEKQSNRRDRRPDRPLRLIDWKHYTDRIWALRKRLGAG